MMTFLVRLKKARQPNQPRLRSDPEKVRDLDVACTFQAAIGEKFAPLITLQPMGRKRSYLNHGYGTLESLSYCQEF